MKWTQGQKLHDHSSIKCPTTEQNLTYTIILIDAGKKS